MSELLGQPRVLLLSLFVKPMLLHAAASIVAAVATATAAAAPVTPAPSDTAAATTNLSASSSPNTEFGAAGAYDQLVLARFWEPQAHKCSSWGARNLTLHGLWPQYASHHPHAPKGLPGDWPQFCGKSQLTFWQKVQPLQKSVAAVFKQQWASVAPDYVAGTLGQHVGRH